MAGKSRARGLTKPNLVLVRGARQLITLHGGVGPRRGAEMSCLSIIPDGALLIRNGVIEEVGPTRRIERLKLAQDAAEVDASGCVVLPAFVDSGTRPIFRHGVEANFEKGVASFAAASRAVLLTTGAAVLAGMVRHGTVTTEALTGYGGDSEGETRLIRLYASLQGRYTNINTSLVLSGYIPAEFPGTAAQWTREVVIPLLTSAAGEQRVQSATASLAVNGASPDEAREFLWAAQTNGLLAKILATPDLSDVAVALALASEAHAVQGLEGPLTASCDALANSTTIVTLTPGITYAQGRDSFGPARALIDRGAALALATGFCRETTGNYNMVPTMELACRYAGMTAAEAISAATINAAHAVGCADRCGSVEPGKRADLVLFDCPSYLELMRNPGVHQVNRVLRMGQTVYRRGRVEEPA